MFQGCCLEHCWACCLAIPGLWLGVILGLSLSALLGFSLDCSAETPECCDFKAVAWNIAQCVALPFQGCLLVCCLDCLGHSAGMLECQNVMILRPLLGALLGTLLGCFGAVPGCCLAILGHPIAEQLIGALHAISLPILSIFMV